MCVGKLTVYKGLSDICDFRHSQGKGCLGMLPLWVRRDHCAQKYTKEYVNTKDQKVCSFLFFYFIYLFLAVLGLPCCAGFSLVVASRAYSLVAVYRFLTAEATGTWALGCKGFSSCGSWALEHRLNSCSTQA